MEKQHKEAQEAQSRDWSLATRSASKLQCHNPHPKYVPKPGTKARPGFIQRCRRAVQKFTVALWVGFVALIPIDPKTKLPLARRQRRIRPECAAGLQAVVECLADNVSIFTGQVWVTIEQIAEMCGLSTTSEAGNYSITRASRLIYMLEIFGLVECVRKWDPVLGIKYPTLIFLTPLFFKMIGIDQNDWELAKKQQEAYKNRGIISSVDEQLSSTEIRERAVAQSMAAYYAYREKRRGLKKERIQAAEILSKAPAEQRHWVSLLITKNMSTEQLKQVGIDQINVMIDEALIRLRRTVSTPPPLIT